MDLPRVSASTLRSQTFRGQTSAAETAGQEAPGQQHSLLAPLCVLIIARDVSDDILLRLRVSEYKHIK